MSTKMKKEGSYAHWQKKGVFEKEVVLHGSTEK
jgi:hypothetical protein